MVSFFYFFLEKRSRILITKELSGIGLMKANDCSRLSFSTIFRALSCNSKTERDVIHGKDDDALISGGVFSDTTKSCFEDMISIEKAHFCTWFNPDFVICILREIVDASDLQSELARLGELAETSAHRNKLVTRERFGKVCQLRAKIVHLVAMKAEAEIAVRSIDQLFDVFSDAGWEIFFFIS